MDVIHRLPPELQCEVLSYLDPQDVANLLNPSCGAIETVQWLFQLVTDGLSPKFFKHFQANASTLNQYPQPESRGLVNLIEIRDVSALLIDQLVSKFGNKVSFIVLDGSCFPGFPSPIIERLLRSMPCSKFILTGFTGSWTDLTLDLTQIPDISRLYTQNMRNITLLNTPVGDTRPMKLNGSFSLRVSDGDDKLNPIPNIDPSGEPLFSLDLVSSHPDQGCRYEIIGRDWYARSTRLMYVCRIENVRIGGDTMTLNLCRTPEGEGPFIKGVTSQDLEVLQISYGDSNAFLSVKDLYLPNLSVFQYTCDAPQFGDISRDSMKSLLTSLNLEKLRSLSINSRNSDVVFDQEVRGRLCCLESLNFTPASSDVVVADYGEFTTLNTLFISGAYKVTGSETKSPFVKAPYLQHLTWVPRADVVSEEDNQVERLLMMYPRLTGLILNFSQGFNSRAVDISRGLVHISQNLTQLVLQGVDIQTFTEVSRTIEFPMLKVLLITGVPGKDLKFRLNAPQLANVDMYLNLRSPIDSLIVRGLPKLDRFVLSTTDLESISEPRHPLVVTLSHLPELQHLSITPLMVSKIQVDNLAYLEKLNLRTSDGAPLEDTLMVDDELLQL